VSWLLHALACAPWPDHEGTEQPSFPAGKEGSIGATAGYWANRPPDHASACPLRCKQYLQPI